MFNIVYKNKGLTRFDSGDCDSLLNFFNVFLGLYFWDLIKDPKINTWDILLGIMTEDLEKNDLNYNLPFIFLFLEKNLAYDCYWGDNKSTWDF